MTDRNANFVITLLVMHMTQINQIPMHGSTQLALTVEYPYTSYKSLSWKWQPVNYVN